MKYMEFAGKTFEVFKSKHAQNNIEHHSSCWNYDDIYQAYEKPSRYKVGIFNDWRKWCDECNEARNMRITSRNTFAFSLGAFYVDPETLEILGYFSITRDHTRLFLLKD